MGGCATKPKELKAETAEATAPAPANEEAGKISEAKEVMVVDKDGEIVDVDEHGNKHKSLGNLFKESEEGKDSTEDDKMPSEPIKQEPIETEKATNVSDTKIPEVEKSEISAEQTPKPVVVDTPVKAGAETSIEVALATESRKPESPEKNAEEQKPATEIQQPKTEEEKPATVIQNPSEEKTT